MVLSPNFIEAMRRLHPDASPLKDFLVKDNSDGNGPFLAEWNLSYNSPTDDEIAAAMTRPPMTALTYEQFRALFTTEENQAIMTAAQTNHAVLDWLLQAVGANRVNLAGPQVKAGLDALVVAGLISRARQAQVLANQAPPAT